MTTPKIRIYPVFNGTCILLVTADNLYILIDCKITRTSEDPNNQEAYDVKRDLLDILPENEYGAPYVHLFVLTHPDQDHCHGFANHFYTGTPEGYKSSHREAQLIMVDEIWSTKLIYGEVCTDALCIRKEVNRRRNLYKNPSRDQETSFSRLTMIGYNDDNLYNDCPYYIPGDTVNRIAGKTTNYLSVFLHAPFKKSLISAQATADRNSASIVAQYTLFNSQGLQLKLLEGGDADHYRWSEIKRQTENHGNQDRLRYDVLVAPHHCSWSYFNDTPYRDNKEPQQAPKEIISHYGEANSFVLSSSKIILDDDNNPPHYPAKTEYLDSIVASAQFLCTMEEPCKARPQPIDIELTTYGIKKVTKQCKEVETDTEDLKGYLAANPGIKSYCDEK